jgi:hypothetical protein
MSLAADDDQEKPDDWQRRLEMLRSVPYLGTTEETVTEGQTGVLYWIPEKACPGYNFYCTKDTREAFLLDMDGQIVHRWNYPSQTEKTGGSDHAILLDNGDLIVIRKNEELLRIDWNSEVLWKKKMIAHHDVAVSPDGSIYVIVQQIWNYRDLRVWFDTMIHLTADGEEIDRWETHRHLDELKAALDTSNFLDTVLDQRPNPPPPSGDDSLYKERPEKKGHGYDYFHMNTITVLPPTALGERDRRFRAGNLLVCFRSVNQIAVLERDTYRILWAWGEGQLEWPHHPTLLSNGRILIFDNGIERQRSRVLEMDPLTGEIVWEYAPPPPEVFYSYTRGSAQRLSNGNTLICESDKGRAFEVSPGGEIVWIWLNPDTIGGTRKTVYRMIRHPVSVIARLLQEDEMKTGSEKNRDERTSSGPTQPEMRDE